MDFRRLWKFSMTFFDVYANYIRVFDFGQARCCGHLQDKWLFNRSPGFARVLTIGHIPQRSAPQLSIRQVAARYLFFPQKNLRVKGCVFDSQYHVTATVSRQAVSTSALPSFHHLNLNAKFKDQNENTSILIIRK